MNLVGSPGKNALQVGPRRTLTDQSQACPRHLLQHGLEMLKLLLGGDTPDIEQHRIVRMAIGELGAHGFSGVAGVELCRIDATPPQADFFRHADLAQMLLDQP